MTPQTYVALALADTFLAREASVEAMQLGARRALGKKWRWIPSLCLRLQALAASLNAGYSRYADDLAFSGDGELERAMDRFHVQVAAIALEEGFSVNTRKTRMMRSGARQQLTGIVVNRHPNIPRQELDNLKAALTNCIRHGPASQNRDDRDNHRQFLAGRIAYVQMVNPQRGKRLQRLFDKIAWPDG